MAGESYVERLADPVLADLLASVPALMLTGPRAAGKTTTARRLAADVLRLDDPSTAAVVSADPDAALRRSTEPLLIDEWQEVPQILGALKRAVDDDPRPGRFILTGSVEADLTTKMWPGTGRVVRVVLDGLTRREVDGRTNSPGLLSHVLSGDLAAVGMPTSAPSLDDYVELAVTGGFPEPALRLPARARADWLDSYVDHVVTRDVIAVGQTRDPVRFRRYLETLALSTAGLPTDTTLYETAGINSRTADAYDRLLSALFLVDLVPPWASNRISRLVKRPKRYICDPGVAAAAARIDQAAALSDHDLLGRLLDTFVAAQLRPEVRTLQARARLHHLRTDAGRHEVDLIVDLGAGRVVGIEVKAGSAPSRKDVRHLVWLREQLGEKFVRAIVFHTGKQPFELDERIWALPIAALWA